MGTIENDSPQAGEVTGHLPPRNQQEAFIRQTKIESGPNDYESTRLREPERQQLCHLRKLRQLRWQSREVLLSKIPASRRWSQTVRRLPAKQLQVGSTPTGVSFRQVQRVDAVRPAVHLSEIDELYSGHGF